MSSDSEELHELERQARRLETACSIIQVAHEKLSLESVLEGIVQGFVQVGEFAGAQVEINAVIDDMTIQHAASAGELEADVELTRRTPVFVRGIEMGAITTRSRAVDELEGQGDLLEFVLPTLSMAIDHAISFAEVLDYRATLERKVEERTAQLADAHRQLSRSLDDVREAKAARDRFFANINHEIRTPLTLIQLAVDGVERSGEGLTATSRQRLQEIHAATRRLLDLVNSLLLLAAGDERKLRIKPTPLDVAACLRRLVLNWQGAAARGELELVFDGPQDCRGTLDESAIDTIVGNFISNAVKFTPAHGRISVILYATEDTITVDVRDTGPGIDPEFASRMFGRFERSAEATAKGVRGSGIGLSLSKELIERQGGKIEVLRRGDPRGTSFIATLPRHQAIAAVIADADDRQTLVRASEPESPAPASADAPAPPPAPQPNLRNAAAEATIVLAEDDPALARDIADILSAHYTVHIGRNGREALELAKLHVPDLLVTDLDMPEMNGLELTRRFLELDGTGLSPVLIVSAHARLGEKLAGFEAGAVDYVVKPFLADELLARIRSQLAIRRLALKLHESQKLAALGMMSAGLAHELRNPANAIVNSVELLVDLLPESVRKPGAIGMKLVDVLRAGAVQVRDLCRNVLDFSRTGTVTMDPVDPAALVRHARLVLAAKLVQVEVVEDIQVEGEIHCAGALVEQILINLVDNAVDAAGPGGTVEVSARRDNTTVVIEVSDSGPGVPAHLHERIFEPFFTTKKVGQGTGLGLSISRRIALNHGGDLRVVRRAEKTLFRLELPQP